MSERCPIGLDKSPMFCSAGSCDVCQFMRKLGAQARAEGYAEGVEAAAKRYEEGGDWDTFAAAAEAIRALTAPSGKERDLRIPSDAPYIKPDIAVSGDEDVP